MDVKVYSTYKSLGCEQLILKINSSFSEESLLITVEEQYTVSGLLRPILVLEQGILRKDKSNRFYVERRRLHKVFKNLSLSKKDSLFIKSKTGTRGLEILLNFLETKHEESVKYNTRIKLSKEDKYLFDSERYPISTLK